MVLHGCAPGWSHEPACCKASLTSALIAVLTALRPFAAQYELQSIPLSELALTTSTKLHETAPVCESTLIGFARQLPLSLSFSCPIKAFMAGL